MTAPVEVTITAADYWAGRPAELLQMLSRSSAEGGPRAIPDPSGLGGEMNFFRLPFYTIESVHVVDERTLLVASDNNFPFSNGRSRSRGPDRKGPLLADDTDIILIHLGTPLDVDRRLLGNSR